MFKKFTLGVAAAAAAATAVVPAAAEAHGRGRAHGYHSQSAYSQSYRDDGRYYGNTYRDGYRRCSGTTGTILGAAAGALLGRAIDSRGSRVMGTVVGGAGGALLGRQVGKSTCRR